MTAATCPSCGHAQSVFAIFIRLDGDLVCKSCRDSVTAIRHRDGGVVAPEQPPPAVALPPHRHLLERRIG